jgi:ABC-type nickel/cobalt efflux system permease component RcnA
MVPCPTALVVLLAAVAMHRIVFGLTLILAFSVGLAAVLIAIGVLAVTATRLMTRSAAESRWVSALPAASAGVIMLVGISIAVGSLVSGGVLTVSW